LVAKSSSTVGTATPADWAIARIVVAAYPLSTKRLCAASTTRARVRWACSARLADRYGRADR
jgi:hypothetical protein